MKYEAPFTAVFCSHCGQVPPRDDLTLAAKGKVRATGRNDDPTTYVYAFHILKCSNCGRKSTHETRKILKDKNDD